jgi:TrpR family trp operon transcriptional repressor
MPLSPLKKQLLRTLQSAAHTGQLDAFLEDLLTLKEYQELAVRWEIIRRLAKGDPQRHIADELGVGIATVTRGARMLQNPQGGFHRMLKQ